MLEEVMPWSRRRRLQQDDASVRIRLQGLRAVGGVGRGRLLLQGPLLVGVAAQQWWALCPPSARRLGGARGSSWWVPTET